jgi:1,4-alpha-glucan branching enzyme
VIRCERAKGEGEKVKVTFVLPADEPAAKVIVAGDFNDWDEGGITLRKRGETRSVSLVLDPGRRYAFRYRAADGSWFNDPDAHAYEPNEFGDHNSIIDLTGT